MSAERTDEGEQTMAADDLTELLQAELALGEALIETLKRQRAALFDRDTERMNELTEVLEGQLGQFAELLERRFDGGEDASRPTFRQHELIERVRRTEARVTQLADFNQELIADRLAWSNAMLSAMGLGESGAGYGRDDGGDSPSASAVSRSA
jgi:hypothetical protein